mmetsp:Transcript_3936/g.5893  ORF Transcript_3936/g.5893 Transcript_3936/m.5893 type:complete len:211 (-) Transcript_3936:92-724(-)
MAAFKAQSMASISNTTFFPGMSMAASFDPSQKMAYFPQPTGTFLYPMVNCPPPTLPPCEAKLPSPTTFGVDFDQLLQEEPIAFRKEHQREEQEKEQDPLSGFTFYPVSRHDYMKRKATKKDDRHRKRRRHSAYVEGRLTMTNVESEKDKLKMRIRAMRDQMRNERNTPSPSGGDCCPVPCPITPAESSEMICPVDAEDLMKALQGSELFA